MIILDREKYWHSPKVPVVINRDHPLAFKLKQLIVPQQADRLRDLVDPRRILTKAGVTPTIKGSKFGRALDHAGSAGQGLIGSTNAPWSGGLPANLNVTLLALVQMNATTAARVIYQPGGGPSTQTQYIRLATHPSSAGGLSAAVMASWGGAVMEYQNNTSGFAAGDAFLFGCSFTSNSALTMYKNGRSITNDGGGGSVTADRHGMTRYGTCDCRESPAISSADCRRMFLASFFPVLDAEEHRLIYTEGPFAFVKPRIERSWHLLAPAAGVTEKTATDTLLPMTAEAAVLLSALGRADSLTPMTAEASSLLAVLGRADTLSPFVAEAVALARSSVVADTLLVLLSEAATVVPLGAQDNKSATDTLTPMTGEAAGIAASLAAAEALLVVLAEVADLAATAQASDALAIGWGELAAVVAALGRADTLSPMTGEAAVLTQARAVADSLGITLSELATLFEDETPVAAIARILLTAQTKRLALGAETKRLSIEVS